VVHEEIITESVICFTRTNVCCSKMCVL